MLKLVQCSSLLLICGALACGDDAGVAPAPPVVSSLSGTVDGVPWTAENASGVAYAADSDTTFIASGVNGAEGTPGAHWQQLTLILHGLGPAGSYDLKDFSSQAYGVFLVSEGSSNPDSMQTFGSTTTAVGSLIITHLNRAAKTIAGSYDFEAKTSHGPLASHHLVGTFQLNYDVQRVSTTASVFERLHHERSEGSVGIQ